MKIILHVLGILIIIGSGFIFIASSLAYSNGNSSEQIIQLFSYSVLGVIIGIFMIAGSSIAKNNKNNFDMQEFEEFKRYQEQQRQIHYRYANAQGKPISEYLMDDRTKLMTYYDRMPSSYQNKLIDYVETLYRNFENEEYLNQK